MSDSIECLWAEGKRRISERIEQTPSRRNSGPPFIISPDPDFEKRLVAAMERGLSQNRDAALKPASKSETIGARHTERSFKEMLNSVPDLTDYEKEFVTTVPLPHHKITVEKIDVVGHSAEGIAHGDSSGCVHDVSLGKHTFTIEMEVSAIEQDGQLLMRDFIKRKVLEAVNMVDLSTQTPTPKAPPPPPKGNKSF